MATKQCLVTLHNGHAVIQISHVNNRVLPPVAHCCHMTNPDKTFYFAIISEEDIRHKIIAFMYHVCSIEVYVGDYEVQAGSFLGDRPSTASWQPCRFT